MKNCIWLDQLIQKNSLWYRDNKTVYPPIFYQLYDRLLGLAADGNLYGFFLQLRDIFEWMPRWYDLTGFALAAYMQDMDTVSLLCNPERAFSFGDWVQIPPTKLKKHASVGNTSLGKILELLNREYNKRKIVAWRNEAIGHGALQPDTSQEFLDVLEEKLGDLQHCLYAAAPLAEKIRYQTNTENVFCCSVDGGPLFPTEPFLREVSGDHWLFDSLVRGTCTGKVLSYQAGKRMTVDMTFFHQLSSRYYGSVPITAEGSFDDEVFSGKLETVLQHFHSAGQYWTQTHYFDWLTACMSKHRRGVFLLRSESGTGKSAFAGQLDGYGKQKLFKKGVLCRSYYFSRTSVRRADEFPVALSDLFRGVPEYEDELHGQVPVLEYRLPPEQRGDAMVAFLQAFHSIYQRTYAQKELLLILDGIDHLAPENTHLLNFVPSPDVLPEGVYLLVICSSFVPQDSFQQTFLGAFPFTEKVTFQKEEENADVLKKAISESVTLSGKALDGEQIQQIMQVVDYRFTALPVIRALLEQTDRFEDVLCASSLLDAYVDMLKRLYGAAHFPVLQAVLLTLALAVEPLSIRLISRLAFGHSPTAELLAIMKDLSPLLSSDNRKSQTMYILGHPDFGSQLRRLYLQECKELVQNWKQEISGVLDFGNIPYDSTTYIASGIVLWCRDILEEEVSNLSMLENITYIAEWFSQTQNTAPHIVRTSRILMSAQEAFTNCWHTTGYIRAAADALHSLAVSIPKMVLTEDIAGCIRADEFSEALIGELTESAKEEPAMVQALFSIMKIARP